MEAQCRLMITDEMLTTYALPACLAALMAYMLFIVIRLAIDSKAGKEGLFVLVIGLMVGVLGFLFKLAIQFTVETSL